MTAVSLPVVAQRPLWRTAQWAGLGLTVALLLSLVMAPTPTLRLLWDMVIPLLPAVFLVNPMIWRNVCPLATLNEVTSARRGAGSMDASMLRRAWALGIVLLFVMVPARRFLFNAGGVPLAVTIGVVALLALLGGTAFARRAGFCNSICPVLPVEKLYGQVPIVPIGSARCVDCTHCVGIGCPDVAGTRTVPQTLGAQRGETAWLRTSFGAFAAAFPGFILGYFTTENGALGTAGSVYLWILGMSAISYVIVAVLTRAFSIRAAIAMPTLATLALGAYYWHAAKTLVEAYRAPTIGLWVIRVLVAAVLAWWLVRALRTRPRSAAPALDLGAPRGAPPATGSAQLLEGEQ